MVADDTTYGRLYDHLKADRARGTACISSAGATCAASSRCCATAANLVLFCDGGYRGGDVPVEFLRRADDLPGRSGHALGALRRTDAAGLAASAPATTRSSPAACRSIRADERRPGRDLPRDAGARRRARRGDRRGSRAVVHVPPRLAADRCRARRRRAPRSSGAPRRGLDEARGDRVMRRWRCGSACAPRTSWCAASCRGVAYALADLGGARLVSPSREPARAA